MSVRAGTKSTPLTVESFMTKTPHGIEPHEKLSVARTRMETLHARHLPVRSGGKVVGILSERDLILLANLDVDFNAKMVGIFMTPDPYKVSASTPVAEVAAQMAERRIGSALVVDDADRLLGIFTDTDALLAVARLAGNA